MFEAFLVACLSAQPLGAQGYQIDKDVRVIQMVSEEELAERIRKIHDVEDVFIHPIPHEDKMREHGWERFPVRINGKEVWIKRKPVTDSPKHRAVQTSA